MSMIQQKSLCAPFSFKLGIALQERVVIFHMTSPLNVFLPVFISYAVDVPNPHVAMHMCASIPPPRSVAILLSLGTAGKVPFAMSVIFMNALTGLTQELVITSDALCLMLTEQDKSENILLLLTM